MELAIILGVLAAALAIGLAVMYNAHKSKSCDYESLLKAIQSPICIVDERGRLVKIINRKYVKESAFDMDSTDNYDMTRMIEDEDDKHRFMKNLKDVITEQASNYVNQSFIVKDHYGTAYRALLHIVYYKAGMAYVFINRIRLPKDN